MSQKSRWPAEALSAFCMVACFLNMLSATTHQISQRLWSTAQIISFSDSHFTQERFSPEFFKNDSNQRSFCLPELPFYSSRQSRWKLQSQGGVCRERSLWCFAWSLLSRCSCVPLRSRAGGRANPAPSRTQDSELSFLDLSTCFGPPTPPQALQHIHLPFLSKWL